MKTWERRKRRARREYRREKGEGQKAVGKRSWDETGRKRRWQKKRGKEKAERMGGELAFFHVIVSVHAMEIAHKR